MIRRTFLTQTAMATGAILLHQACGQPTTKKEDNNNIAIGLQLYSLRDEVPNGLDELLGKIAAMGYTHIETYGYDAERKYFGNTVKEMAALLDKHNLKSPSAHVYHGPHVSGNDDDFWKKACEDAANMNQEYIVLPFMEEAYRPKDETGYSKMIDLLNRSGKIAKEAGMKFAYHNHDFEFKYDPVLKKSLYQVMLEDTDPALVKMELDLFWAVYAEVDPLMLFAQHPDRFQLWHVKDMNPTTRQNADVGSGSIDFKTIFGHQKESGLQYFFVEQENYDVSPLESIKNSFNYVKSELVSKKA